MNALRPIPSNRNQRGIVMVLVLVGMLAMLGMVGLALDGGHGMLNKSRLQNVVDSAALAAAKVLDLSGGDEALATAEALRVFNANAVEDGNDEIAAMSAGINVGVVFSNTILPFTPGTTPARYVRVRATGFDLPGWFIPAMGVTEKRVAASAIAGPSPTLARTCNLAPMMVCGEAGAENYGYQPGEVEVLKTASGSGEFEVGPGNFQLVRLEGNQGAADIRVALAGGYDPCLDTEGEIIPTEPGNTIGPVAQGLNTRLGIYSGPISPGDYPSDLVQAQISPLTLEGDVVNYDGAPISDENPLPWGYPEYMAHLMDPGYMYWNGEYDATGEPLRRVLRLPVGDCDGTTNGAGEVPMLGVMCFFLLQEVTQQGNEAHVFGQFMGADASCPVTGNPGPEAVDGPGPYRIQLYKDPNWDSA